MTPIELSLATLVLGTAVSCGLVAHELSHALALRAAGIPYDLEWLPGRGGDGLLHAGLTGTWATVRPRRLPTGTAPWRLRVAALTPLALVAPVALVPAGVLPDPFAAGDPYLQAFLLGWMACAIPSPQDFSLAWYAERAMAEYDGATETAA